MRVGGSGAPNITTIYAQIDAGLKDLQASKGAFYRERPPAEKLLASPFVSAHSSRE